MLIFEGRDFAICTFCTHRNTQLKCVFIPSPDCCSRFAAKAFKSSDHVKVTDGHFTGETGLVVKIDGDVIHVVSDLTLKEIKVKASDLQLASDVSSGMDSLGQFGLHDLGEGLECQHLFFCLFVVIFSVIVISRAYFEMTFILHRSATGSTHCGMCRAYRARHVVCRGPRR